MKVLTLSRDNNNLHESTNDYIEMLRLRDIEVHDGRIEIEQLISQLSHMKSILSTQTISIPDIGEDSLVTKKRISDLEDEIINLKNELIINEKELSKNSCLYIGLQTKYDAQTIRLTNIMTEHASCSDIIDTLRSEAASVEDIKIRSLLNLQNLLDETLHALASEKIAVDLLREEDNGLIKKYSRMEDEYTKCKTELAFMTSELSISKHHMNDYEKELECLRVTLKEYQELLNQRDCELAESQRNAEKLFKQQEKLENELNKTGDLLTNKEVMVIIKLSFLILHMPFYYLLSLFTPLYYCRLN